MSKNEHPPQGSARLGRAVGGLVLAACCLSAWSAPDIAMPAAADATALATVAAPVADAPLPAVAPVAKAFVDNVRNKASDMVLTAMNFLGVPYRRGGTTVETGFDCSGFTRQVFSTSIGLVLPRRADEQARAAGLVSVKRDQLEPGDLVFFNTLRRNFSHVGIYVGEGKFIHAPRTGGEVRVEDMRFVYWAKRFTGARRPDPVVAQAVTDASPAPPATVEAAATATR
jgi:cell wall-associated NlpC family hydrolase